MKYVFILNKYSKIYIYLFYGFFCSTRIPAHYGAPDGRNGAQTRSGHVELQGGGFADAHHRLVQGRRTIEGRSGCPSDGIACRWAVLSEGKLDALVF